MKKILLYLGVVVSVILGLLGFAYVAFFGWFAYGKFCSSYKVQFDVPAEIMSQEHRDSAWHEMEVFSKDGKAYERRQFQRYLSICTNDVSFEIGDIVAFRESRWASAKIGKISSIDGDVYTVVTEFGVAEVRHDDIIARD